jgi:hypothetical protein
MKMYEDLPLEAKKVSARDIRKLKRLKAKAEQENSTSADGAK